MASCSVSSCVFRPFVFGCFLAFTLLVHRSVASQRATLHGWEPTDVVARGDEKVSFQIQLSQRNLDVLSSTLMDVSDPSSSNYGEHLSVGAVRKLVGRSREEIASVVRWITQDGCGGDSSAASISIGPTHDYLFVQMSSSCAQTLFRATLYQWRFTGTGLSPDVARIVGERAPPHVLRTVSNANGLEVPQHLSHVISRVFGLSSDDLPPPARLLSAHPGNSKGVSSFPGVKMNPPLIKKLYHIGPNAFGHGHDGYGQAVAEFEEAYFYPSDLAKFESVWDIPSQPVERIIGKNDPANGYLGEATLDVEYIIGVGNNVTTWDISLEYFDLISWSQLLMNLSLQESVPLVHSISWGSGESGFDVDQMRAIDVEFQKLGALGFTVLAASGDKGTGHTGTFWCGHFDPTFPASSPHVLAVGGTYLTSSSGGGEEIAVSFSGGGFSGVFPRRSHQKNAVSEYIANGNLPSQEYWNKTGRGLPDVSAVSTNFQMVSQNWTGGTLSGTSAATPTFAAILAMINDARLVNAQPPLGYINPLLYDNAANGGIGTDILKGNNKVYWCDKGFEAAKGWDAVSGLGTPNFELLHNVFVK